MSHILHFSFNTYFVRIYFAFKMKIYKKLFAKYNRKQNKINTTFARRRASNAPWARDVCEAADRTLREPTVDHFEVPFCTETLNTTHI